MGATARADLGQKADTCLVRIQGVKYPTGITLPAMDAYAVLGVDPVASDKDIRDAYVRRSKLLHPDQHVNADADVQAEATRAMQEVNAAYRVIGNPTLRADYDRQRRSGANASPRQPQSNRRPPSPTECLACGSTPATPVTLRREAGFIIWRSRSKVAGPFCQTCGMSLFREMQNSTLLRGWWGVISFFANLSSIFWNLNARRHLKRLGPPTSRASDVEAPLPGPIPVGAPLHRRAGIYVTAAALAIFVAAGAADSEEPIETDNEILVGTCFTMTADGYFDEIVSCTDAWDGKVVDVVGNDEPCPSNGDNYFDGEDEDICFYER